jgi:hypothetical protein
MRPNIQCFEAILAPRATGSRSGTAPQRICCCSVVSKDCAMGKGLLLWLIGVPIPVILLLWLFFH